MDAPGIGIHQAAAHRKRPRAAAAAQLPEFAAAALSLQHRIAQGLKGERLIPYVPEFFVADVAFFLGNIRTGRHTAFRRNAAIMNAREAAAAFVASGAGERRCGVALVGDALEMRRTARADQQVTALLLCRHQLVEHPLIGDRADVRHGFAAPGAYQKEHVQHPRPCGAGEGYHGLDFIGIGFGDGEMYLEGQVMALAGFNSSHGFFPSASQAAKGIVFLGIEGIDANADAHRSGGLQRLHALVAERHAVRSNHHREAAPGAMRHQLFQVAAHQRLAAGEHDHGLGAAARDIIQQAAHLFRSEFIFAAMLHGFRVHVAMSAGEIAAFGQVDGEQK